MRDHRSRVERRLDGYWKMELANIMLLPAVVVGLGWVAGARPGALTVLGLLPNLLLLAVGGLYWRAKLHRMQGRPETMAGLLPIAQRCRLPTGILTAMAVAAVVVAWLPFGPSGTSGDRVMATIFAVSAVVEFINYYWRQVQHFDHRADLKRLLSGKGFRPAHLARDLARWRAVQS